jgi:hypothetical protein
MLTRRQLIQGAIAAPLTSPLLSSASEGREGFRFGVIADVQYADVAANGSRHYRASLPRLRQCVEHFQNQPLAFVINLGDLIDRDFTSFDPVLDVLEELSCAVYHVLGNHDYAVPAGKKDQVPARLGLERGYYSQSLPDGWRLVVLDGNRVSTFANPEQSASYRQAQQLLDELEQQDAPNAHPWNGGVDQQQSDWLDQLLTEADRAGENVLVCCHYPLYPAGPHNLLNDAKLRKIFAAHPSVRAYLNGHNHKGAYGQHAGLHFVTHHAMVETSDTTAYAVGEVRRDTLRLRGFGREPDRTLR